MHALETTDKKLPRCALNTELHKALLQQFKESKEHSAS